MFGKGRSIETWRESCLLRDFERFEASKHSVNHIFYEVLSPSEHRNTARSTILRGVERFEASKHSVNPYLARSWAFRSIATQREAHILRGFKPFEAWKHSLNHVFCRVLSTSQHWNMAWTLILQGFEHFVRRIEAWRESFILQGFGCFEALIHRVKHACCMVLSASKHWNTGWIMKFARFQALRGIETQRETSFCCEVLNVSKHPNTASNICKVLSISTHRSMAWITYFASFWALRSIETQREL